MNDRINVREREEEKLSRDHFQRTETHVFDPLYGGGFPPSSAQTDS